MFLSLGSLSSAMAYFHPNEVIYLLENGNYNKGRAKINIVQYIYNAICKLYTRVPFYTVWMLHFTIL